MAIILALVVDFAVALTGTVLTFVIVALLRFRAHSRGYLMKAFLDQSAILWPFFLISSLVAAVVVELTFDGGRMQTDFVETLPMLATSATIFGGALVIATAGFEYFAIGNRDLGEAKRKSAVFRAIVRVQLFRRIKGAAGRLKIQDSVDYMDQFGWWNFGLNRVEARRRVRIWYEVYKFHIATSERAYRYFINDVHVLPGEKFFLLLRYLGRKELHQVLSTPPPLLGPGGEWDGSERRRQRGTSEARKNPPLHTKGRAYDRADILRVISAGRAFPGPLPVAAHPDKETALLRGLERQMLEKLQEALRGPVLDNYRGFLCLQMTTQSGDLIPIADHGWTCSALEPIKLLAWLRPEPARDGLSEPVIIRGGRDSPGSTFEVQLQVGDEVESGWVSLKRDEASNSIEMNVPARPMTGSHEVAVEIRQKDRLVGLATAELLDADGSSPRLA